MDDFEKSREGVLIVHGLWLNSFAMLYVADGLERAGFAAESFDYHSMRGTLEEHVAKLASRVAATSGERLHVVAHSMGGIVALNYLQHSRDPRIGRVLLLGSPVTGSLAARKFADWPGGAVMLGRSVDIWLSDQLPRLDPGTCVAAIAGSNPVGLGSIFLDLPGPNDGVVMVEETRVEGMADHIVLPVSHSGMLFSHEVVRQATAFLQHGRFER